MSLQVGSNKIISHFADIYSPSEFTELLKQGVKIQPNATVDGNLCLDAERVTLLPEGLKINGYFTISISYDIPWPKELKEGSDLRIRLSKMSPHGVQFFNSEIKNEEPDDF